MLLATRLLKQFKSKQNVRSLAEIVDPHCVEVSIFHENGALVCVYRLSDNSAIKETTAQKDSQK